MRAAHVELSLAELQQALREYCAKQGFLPLPDSVTVVSYTKSISVELFPNGLVTAEEFRHRAGAE